MTSSIMSLFSSIKASLRGIALFAAGVLLTSGAVLPAHAQIGEGHSADPRIRELLDDLGLKYKMTDNGNYKLEYDVDDGRTQVVYIESDTEKLDNLEVREVWSAAYACQGALPSEVATKLLRQNGKVKLGAWEIDENNGKTTAIFTAKIAANATGGNLKTALEAVCKTADKMEKELTGRDDY